MGTPLRAWVLLILTAAYFGTLANAPVSTTLLALGHVRLCAAMAVVQSLAALVLSVSLTLLTDLGIYGIAIGMALPMIATHNVWLFVAGYRSVGGHTLTAARSTVVRWVAGAILFAIPCLLISRLIPQGGWLLFWLKVAIVSALYLPIGLFVVLQKSEGIRLVQLFLTIRPFRKAEVAVQPDGPTTDGADALPLLATGGEMGSPQ